MPPISATQRLDRLPAAERRLLAHNKALCAGWLDWLRAHGRKSLTVYQYGSKCDEFIEYLGSRPLADASLSTLEEWVARPRRGRGHGQLGADSTRAKDVIMLRGLFKWAVTHGHLAHNPAADMEMPTVRNEDPRAIDVDVWARFWGSPLDDEERVAFGLAFYCGLRREEVCRLGPHHFDLAQGRIRDFPRKGDRNSKTSGVSPIVSLARVFEQRHPSLLGDADHFLRPLRTLLEAREGRKWLLPWGERSAARMAAWRTGPRLIPDDMTNPDQINYRLRLRLRDLGMDRAFTPHALRHSFVTYLLRAGVKLEVVSKLANHSNLNVTLRYVRLAEDPLAELVGALNGPLRGSRWSTDCLNL